jgi:hypothetical protein
MRLYFETELRVGPEGWPYGRYYQRNTFAIDHYVSIREMGQV